jgi:AcrR family transcriptional regulator
LSSSGHRPYLREYLLVCGNGIGEGKSRSESMMSRERSYHHGDLREALLQAAEAELAEKGVEGFTLRGCARRAGVSHAAPAHHFRDANALLTALATEGFRRFAAAMRRRQQEATDARGRLVGAGLGYVDFALANPALFRLMFSSARPDFSDPALAEAGQASFEILTDAVRGLDNEHAGRRGDVILDVAAAWSVVHGLAELLLSGHMGFLEEAGDNPDSLYAGIIGRLVLQR